MCSSDLGHAKGDEALKRVAALIRDMVRPYDSVSRWGGDEYLVLTQPADAEDLDALGERIRAAIADACHLRGGDGEPIALSVSVGGYFAGSDEEVERILQRADKALYDAKAAGRNCYRAYAC